MKNRREWISFLEKLIHRVRLDPNFPPNEVHVFNVHAAFGHYQIIIGAAEKWKGKHPRRPLEINGSMHHLFITKNHISAHPTHRQIHDNLKGCIIMRNLTLHFVDPTGSGHKLNSNTKTHGILAQEKINLAGDEGNRILNRMTHTGKLAKDTYRIIQEDILNALTNKQYTVEK